MKAQATDSRGFEGIEFIGGMGNFSIAKAIDASTHKPVLLKFPASISSDPMLVAKLRNEFVILSRLSHPGVRAVRQLTTFMDRPCLVLDYLEGYSFADPQFSSLDLVLKLKAVLQLLEAFEYLQGQRILHLDVSPHNLFYSPTEGQAFITDMGSASEHPSKQPWVELPGNSFVNFSYVSPEMTGRLNLKADLRSDLYSLGLSLYRGFSGKSPFEGGDPASLIFAQLTRMPPRLTSVVKGFPESVAAVVQKMIAKSPESRYQTWGGLKRDFEHCLQELMSGSIDNSFAAGVFDGSSHFSLPNELLGRERERALLQREFKESAFGKFSIVSITGAQGLGKSSLVRDLIKSVYETREMTAVGVGVANRGKIPYHAFVQAAEEIFKGYLALGDVELKNLKGRLMQSLEGNAALVTQLVPSARPLLDDVASLESLPPKEAAIRMKLTLTDFFTALPSAELPVILFLDDFQFSDLPTLAMLEDLASSSSLGFLMVVVAFDPSLIPASHPLLETLSRIREIPNRLTEIKLEPLPQQVVAEYARKTIPLDSQSSDVLAGYLFQKSRGNPALLAELMKDLFAGGVMYFGSSSARWAVDPEKLATFPVTGTFAEVLKARVAELEVDEQDILGKAATIGMQFSIQLLQRVSGIELRQLPVLLDRALEMGLLRPIDTAYYAFRNLAEGGYELPECILAFTHEEIQAALYQNMAKETAQQTHWKVGCLLLEGYNGNAPELAIEIAHHLNLGQQVANDRKTLFDANREAAQSAMSIPAWETAIEYFLVAQEILESDASLLTGVNRLKFFDQAAEAAYLSGRGPLAEKMISKLEGEAPDPLWKGRAQALRLGLYINQGDFSKARQAGFQALKALGIKPPGKLAQLQVLGMILSLQLKLRKKDSSYFLNLPQMTQPESLLAGYIIQQLQPALFNERFELLVYCQLNFFKLTLKNGVSIYAELGLGLWSTLQALVFKNLSKCESLAQTLLELAERSGHPFFLARAHYAQGWNYGYTRPIRDSLPILDLARKFALRSGDLATAVSAPMTKAFASVFAGTPLPELELELKESVALAQNFKYNDMVLVDTMILRFVRVFLAESKPEVPNEIFQDLAADIEKTQFTITRAMCHIYTAILQVHFGRWEEALQHILKARKEKAALVGPSISHHYLFYSTLVFLHCKDAARHAKDVRRNLAELRKLKKGSQENNAHLVAILEAVQAQKKGQFDLALRLFREAANFAREQRFLPEAGLASELCARMLSDQGFEPYARMEFGTAASFYEEWGASWRAQEMKALSGTQSQSTVGSRSLSATAEGVDLLTTMRISQAISGEVQLEGLTFHLLNLLIENAGAEYAAILMPHDNQFKVFVEGSLEDSEIKVGFPDNAGASSRVPLALIRYVSRSKEYLALDDASDSRIMESGGEKLDRPLLSVFCHPVISKGQLLAIIYLENNLMKGAFGPGRIEFLKILSGQISISIENALLYDNLEKRVDERTREIQQKNRELEVQKSEVEFQRRKSDELLLNILPAEVADELKQFGKARARYHPEATIMFLDIISFTRHAEKVTPDELVSEIDGFFGMIDRVVQPLGIEKIKTMGDAYLCAAGLPIADPEHAEKVVRAAILIVEESIIYNAQRKGGALPPFSFRIGIHSGPVVSGVVGTKKFAYDIWGDTVNISARMEQNSQAGKINISESTYRLVSDKFDCISRGKVDVKNKGQMDMYFVEGVK